MPFAALQNDTVHIEKPDGSRIGPFKSSVSSTSATIFDKTLDVNDGEKLVRALPNGREEFYLITSADYSAGLAGIPPHYTLKLQRTTAIRPAASPTSNTTVHINHSTGIQVGNHNVINIQNALNDLTRRIDQAAAPDTDKAEAKSRIAAMLAHPLVGSILGGVAGGLTGLMK